MAFLWFGTLRAQDAFVRLPKDGMTVKQLMAAVEEQTDYLFAYDNRQVDISVGTGFSAGPHALRDLLESMQARNYFTFRINARYIILAPSAASRAPAKADPLEYGYRPTDPSSVEAGSIRRAEEPQPEQLDVPLEYDSSVLQPTAELSEWYSDYLPTDRYALTANLLPGVAVKTNLLYGAATLTPNLSAEIGLGSSATLELYGSYNPWNRIGKPDKNDKLVHWVVRPEYRYWFCERFNGHFVGVNAFFSKYNISGKSIPLLDFEKQFRYEGAAYGAGLSYGYHRPLSKRWAVEFSAGIGLLHTRYEKYDCTLCSGMIEKKGKTYFGPTRASVSLVWMIK